MEGFISGHSLRVGSAVSLAQAGATVVDMQVAGRWKSSQVPGHYAKAEFTERGTTVRLVDNISARHSEPAIKFVVKAKLAAYQAQSFLGRWFRVLSR